MARQTWQEGQEILSSDLNKTAKGIERQLYDRVLQELMGRQSDVVFKDSFKIEYLSGTQITVRAGNGIQADGTQTNPEPTKRPMYLAAQATKTLTTPHATLGRIDIVSAKATLIDSVTESKNIKAIDGTITPTTIVTQQDWEIDIVVTAGTPNVSPAVPSTPAGYIKLAEIAVSAVTGVANQAAITDTRPRYQREDGSIQNIATKTASFLADQDDDLYFMDCTSGHVTATLPLTASVPRKKWGFIKSDGTANNAVLARSGSNTISGETSQTISNRYTVLWAYSTGSEYVLI